MAAQNFDLVKEKWNLEVEFANADESEKVFDGKEQTALSTDGNKPVDFVVDLGESVTLNGFSYLLDQGRWNPGVIFDYEFYVSNKKNSWS